MSKIYSNISVYGDFIYDKNPQNGYLLISNGDGLSSWTSSISTNQSASFRAIINQMNPEVRVNDDLNLGSIWTITSYVDGDDFSNMELLIASTFSGTINGTGSVIKAINGYNEWNAQPNIWSNGSVLSYDGSPFYTSINSDGDYAPFYNSFGSEFIFSYQSKGVYRISSTGSFIRGKHNLSIHNNSGGFGMVRTVRQNDDSYLIITNDNVNQVIIYGATFSTGTIEYPIGITASLSYSNIDAVLIDAYLVIDKWN